MKTTEATSRLAKVVASSRAVLLDFDGPVCSVFAGTPAPKVAASLYASLLADGVAMPLFELAEDDPMVVLRLAAGASEGAAVMAQQRLAQAELEAIHGAAPTPGATELLHACQSTGRNVAIVSNNTTEAISSYLDEHELASLVQHVIGRDLRDIALMKPHPHLLRTALSALTCAPDDAVMIGDAATDIEAARAAGVPVIGYANKPRKNVELAQADAVVTDMHAIADAVASAGRPGI